MFGLRRELRGSAISAKFGIKRTIMGVKNVTNPRTRSLFLGTGYIRIVSSPVVDGQDRHVLDTQNDVKITKMSYI